MGTALKEKLPYLTAEDKEKSQRGICILLVALAVPRMFPERHSSSAQKAGEDPSPEAEQAGWISGSVGALLIPPTPISIVQLYNGDNNNPGAGIHYRGILSKLLCGGC